MTITDRNPHQLVISAIEALQKAWQHASLIPGGASVYLVERTSVVIEQIGKLEANPLLSHHLSLLRQQLLQQRQALLPPQLSAAFIDPNQEVDCPWLNSTQAERPTSLLQLGSAWKKELPSHRPFPEQRLALALTKLPFQSAFHEAAIALRHILRQSSSHATKSLKLLYWLAVVHTLTRLDDITPSGADIARCITGDQLTQLPISYKQIGYEFLLLLNQGDKNLLIEHWGEPTQHQDPKRVFAHFYLDYKTQIES